MRKLLIALCACAAFVPAVAHADNNCHGANWTAEACGGYLVNAPKPAPSKDEQLTTDIHKLMTLAEAVKQEQQLGIVSADVSGWHSSLDVKIGSRNTAKADVIADQLCTKVFSGDLQLQLVGKWKVRVYLADDSVGAECVIR
jgi:hypothetical protein